MSSGGSLLHLAIRHNNLKELKSLLKKGLAPNVFELNVEYPEPGSREERPPLHEACRLGREKFARELLKAGADKSFRDVEKNTPLHAAAEGGLDSLLEEFANDWSIDEKNSKGETPLHRAVFGGSLNAVDWLLHKGADINIEATTDEKAGLTPLHYALGRALPEIVKRLMNAGATLEPKIHLLAPLLKAYDKRKALHPPLEIAADIAASIIEKKHVFAYPKDPFVLSAQLIINKVPKLPTDILKRAKSVIKTNTEAEIKVAVTLADLTKLESLLKTQKKMPKLHNVVLWLPKDEPQAKEIVQLFMKHGADLNYCDDDYGTALQSVIYRKSPYLVKTLIELGADIEQWTKPSGQTPPHSPLSLAAEKNQLEIVRILLKAGAVADSSKLPKDFKKIPKGYIANWLPLGCARNIEVIKELLVAGAEPNYGNEAHRSSSYYLPLEWAVNDDNVEAAKLLLAHGAEFSSEKVAKNFLKRARTKGSQEMIELLAEHRVTHAVRNIFDAILANNGEKVRKYYAKSKDRREKKTSLLPLEYAVKHSRPQMAELLIELGAERDETNEDSMFYACRLGIPAYVKHFWSDDDFKTTVYSQNTLLHIASFWGHVEVVELLLSFGFDIDVKNEDNETPLYAATYHSQEKVINLLLSKGANAKEKDSNGNSMLGQTFGGYNQDRKTLDVCLATMKTLLEAGAEPGLLPPNLASCKRPGASKILELLLQYKADLTVRNCYDRTVLHCAAISGHNELIEFLLSRKVDLNIRSEGQTALHLAAESDKIAIVKRLIAAGAEINAKDWENRTPLDLGSTMAIRDCLRQAGGVTGITSR